MQRAWAVLLVSAAVLGACSSSKSSSSTTTTTVSTSSTTVVAPTTVTSTAATPTTSAAAQNLKVTDALRAELVAAAAADKGLTPADFTGMTPGHTYYAHDNQTNMDWAAGSVQASPSSERAQVSTQDDGAYQLFSRTPGRPWKVYEAGMAGVDGTPCPVQIPAAVLAVWGWAPGTCKPPGG